MKCIDEIQSVHYQFKELGQWCAVHTSAKNVCMREDKIALFKEIENVIPFIGKKLKHWEHKRDNLKKNWNV